MQTGKLFLFTALFGLSSVLLWFALSDDQDGKQSLVKHRPRTDFHAPAKVRQISREDFSEYSAVYRQAVEAGVANEHLFTTEEKLDILAASAAFGKKENNVDEALAKLQFQPSDKALKNRQQYAIEYLQNQEEKKNFVLSQVRQQSLTMSRIIGKAKDEKSRSPEEIKEAEEALRKLKEAEEELAKLKTPLPEPTQDDEGAPNAAILAPVPTEE